MRQRAHALLTLEQRGQRLQLRRGLTARQLRLLDTIGRNELTPAWEQRASNADRVDLAVLLRARIVERTPERSIRLTDSTRFSLDLDTPTITTQRKAA